MYTLNKLAWLFLNPSVLGCMLFVVAVARNRRWLMVTCGLWLWFWTAPITALLLGRGLEAPYISLVSCKVGEMPIADAIVDMGGGIGRNMEASPYPHLSGSADRAWHSVRLWKAGRAPVIIPSGSGIENTDAVFMADMGVPIDAICIENKARNTEENARLVKERLEQLVKGQAPVVLLVTSAWHMRRSVYMFEKYAPDVKIIPAPTDFGSSPPVRISVWSFVPSLETAAQSMVYFHEWLGLLCYRFRK